MYRVIWNYGADTMGLPDPAVPEPPSPFMSAGAPDPFADIELVGNVEPVFSAPPVVLLAEFMSLDASFQEDPDNDLRAYHHAFTPEIDGAERLRERLLNEVSVTGCQIQDRPEPAVVLGASAPPLPSENLNLTVPPTATPSLRAEQRYLEAAPAGINAEYAWSLPGGRGAGMRVIDIEYGWNFLHEDLVTNQGGQVYGVSNACNASVTNMKLCDHGTAVLGEFSGDRNPHGVTGICSDALVEAASAAYEAGPPEKWNTANAIYNTAKRLSPGDVILLEMHNRGIWGRGFYPVEFYASDFAAIAHVTAKGFVVVEAAGNGNENLDDAYYDRAFDRSNRDSGAILVGGGGSAWSATPRSRLAWSNYGSRVDVQGWGEHIVTTGGRSAPEYHDRIHSVDENRCYTKSFGGTSGASPIVAGAVASVNGIVKAAGRPPLTSVEMRELLSTTGTPQTDGPHGSAAMHIGPLPDLRAALDRLGF